MKKQKKIILNDSNAGAKIILGQIIDIKEKFSELRYDERNVEDLSRDMQLKFKESEAANERIIREIVNLAATIKTNTEESDQLEMVIYKLRKENEIYEKAIEGLKNKNETDSIELEEVNFIVEEVVEKINKLRKFERTPHNIGINVGNSSHSLFTNAEYLYRRKSKGNLGLIASIGLDTGEAFFLGLGAKIFLYPSNNNFDPFLKLLASRNINMLHDGEHYDMLYEATVGTHYSISRKFILNGSIGLNYGTTDSFNDTFFVGRFGIIINIFSLN